MEIKQENYNTYGNVHTASYFVPELVCGNSITGEMVRNCRITTRKGKRGTTFRFNPNQRSGGYCSDLGTYLKTLDFCIMYMKAAGIEPELRRIDFKVDCNSADLRKWAKLGTYVVVCFMVKKRVLERNESISYSIRTGSHESTKASTDSYTVTCYNKRLKKVNEGIGYRFEVAYHPRESKTEYESLEILKELLHSLPRASQKAQDMCNARLLSNWQDTAPNYGDKRSINEFIRCNVDFIFTYKQLCGLYELLGKTPEGAKQAAKYFCRQHKRLLQLCKQKELECFCDKVIEYIDKYLLVNEFSKTE